MRLPCFLIYFSIKSKSHSVKNSLHNGVYKEVYKDFEVYISKENSLNIEPFREQGLF